MTDCPKRGYADQGCKLRQGGQESYLSQFEDQKGASYGAITTPFASPTYGYSGAPMGASIEAPRETVRNYKTIVCRHFIRGHCARGTTCGFLHEGEGTTEKPFRVVACKRWIAGHCALDDRCTYKHEQVHPSAYAAMPSAYMMPAYGQYAAYGAPYGAAYVQSVYEAKRSHSPLDNDSYKLQKTFE